MKFGKEFRTHLEETLPDWRDKFLCYKLLKKLLKNLPSAVDSLPPTLRHQPIDADSVDALPGGSARPLMELQEWFVGLLNEELEKFNDFYVDKEEEFVIRFQELKERIEQLKEKSRGGVMSSGSEFSEEMMDIRKDFVTIHGEMVLLKNYSSLNFAGLVKILKKYDKRTGELLRLSFTQLAVHQPFFTTEPLSRLVRECEANLELLFPLEAEVIECPPSTEDKSNQPLNNCPPSTEDKSNQPLNNASNMQAETSSNLGDETMDVYRSTLAAMRAIRGLQKASSTYNPLSFSSIFKSRDDESTGAVTAENSATNSLSSLQDGEDDDKEDARSV